MHLRSLSLIAVAAVATSLVLSAFPVAAPGVQALQGPSPESVLLEKVVTETSVLEEAAASSCEAVIAPEEAPAFLLAGFDPPCIPSSCNKSCIIQGYDFGTCTGPGSSCLCRWYV